VSSNGTRPEGRDQGVPAPTPADPGAAQDPLVLEQDGLRYELDRPPSKGGKKTIVTVRLASGGDGPPLVDRTDLYAFRARYAFAQLVSDTFARLVDVVMGHLAVLLDQVERAALVTAKPARIVLSDARKKAAEALLASPDLLDKAAGAIEALGYVGESRNKRLAYLVATSRLLERPLSAILRAPSGAGKSELLERVAALMPDESVEFLSRLTTQALYYLGPDHLRHRLVLVDEQAGASDADYPIRTLQSRGLLRLATVVRGKTEPFTVHGPIALMSGTTAADLNAENLSRCLELSLDDSPEQTRLIQEAQRRAWSGEKRAAFDVEVWQDAQRLLETLEVVIPFAPKLAFPSRTTRDRREQQKLLGLIAAHALLCQRRRERDADGRVVATAVDYRAIHALYWPLVEAEVEDLSPRAARLYCALVRREAKTPFTRRDAASLTGWTYTTTRRALDELVAHELLKRKTGDVNRYQLLTGAPLATGAALTSPERIERTPRRTKP
jgi:hypothetical protein